MKKKLGRPAKYKTEEEKRNAQTVSSSRSRSKRLLNMPPAERAEYNKKQSEYSKQWRKKNPERAKAYAYKNNNPTEIYAMIRYLLTQAKSRAKKKRIPFNLSLDEAVHIYYFQNGKCAMSGKKMTMGTSNCRFKMSPDQIVPGLGYTKENIQFVTVQGNRSKFKYSTKDTISFSYDMAIHNMIHHMPVEKVINLFSRVAKAKRDLAND